MADYTYDTDIGDWVPKPELEPILAQMKKEESALTLPVSSGRMYMGPSMTPEEEAAFYRSAPGTSIVRVAAPTGPPPTQLERIQAASPEWATPISIRDVPMPITEDPGASKFAFLTEYQRRVAAGVPREKAREDLGLDLLFQPSGVIGPYQQAALALRGREADLRERQLSSTQESQRERFAQSLRKEESAQPEGLRIKYRSLLDAKQKADEGFSDELKLKAQKDLNKFEADNPGFFKKPSVSMPKVGEVRMGYRFKGGDPRVTSNWEIVKK